MGAGFIVNNGAGGGGGEGLYTVDTRVTIPQSSWTYEGDYWESTIALDGLVPSDVPIISVDTTGVVDPVVVDTYQSALSQISYTVNETDSITFIAKSQLTLDLPVNVKLFNRSTGGVVPLDIMSKTIYDPQGKAQDMFGYIDNVFPTTTPNFTGSAGSPEPFGEPIGLTTSNNAGWTKVGNIYTHTPGNTTSLVVTYGTGLSANQIYHLDIKINGTAAGSVGLSQDSWFTFASNVSVTNGMFLPTTSPSTGTSGPWLTLVISPTSTFDGSITLNNVYPIVDASAYDWVKVNSSQNYTSGDWEELIYADESYSKIGAENSNSPYSIISTYTNGIPYKVYMQVNVASAEVWLGNSPTDKAQQISRTYFDLYNPTAFIPNSDYTYLNIWSTGSGASVYIWDSNGVGVGLVSIYNSSGGVALKLNGKTLTSKDDSLVFEQKKVVTEDELMAIVTELQAKIDSLTYEYGTNTNGSYYKYPDGRLECYKTVLPGGPMNTALGTTGWYSQGITQLGNWAYPFTSAPVSSVRVECADTGGKNYSYLSGGTLASATSAGAIYIIAPAQDSTTIIKYVRVMAVGRWK